VRRREGIAALPEAANSANVKASTALPALKKGERRFWLGPGFVSGASDNDPTTVATIAVVGATTGYGLAWLAVLILPMLAAVQAIAASIGAVCRTSIQGVIRREYGLGWAALTLIAVVAVNLMTLTADVEAGSESLALLSGVRYEYFVVPFAGFVGWLLVSKSYLKIERFLSFVPLLFLCYAASAIVARADWAAFGRAIVVPHFDFSGAFAAGALALAGTTLTSYVYMWESIEVAERRPALARVRSVQNDAVAGMLAAGVSFLFILAASAATLGKHHLPVQTAGEVAAALEPLAGRWASALFGIGLLASAVIAVPVLAGTTAYVVTQTFGWSGSLSLRWYGARRFYTVVLGSLALAAGLSFAGLSPIALLYWASIAGGLATPLTLFFAVRIARDRTIMGEHRIGGGLAAAGWITTAVSIALCAAFFVSLMRPGT
jgi:Mn2+/Fe2+ NRAMP family transporter